MNIKIPRTRVKSIMMKCADVEIISKESIHIVATATALFLDQFVKTIEKTTIENKMDYNDVAEVVNTQEKYSFLKEIIPRKVTVKQWKMLMAEKILQEETDSSTDSNETEDERESSSGTGSEQYDADDDTSHNSS